MSSIESGKLSVTIHRGLQGFLELEHDWRRLTASDSRYWIQFDFFSRLIRFALYDQSSVVTFAVRDRDGIVVAIVPARLCTLKIRRIGFSGIELLGASINDMTWQQSSTDFPMDAGASGAAVLRQVILEMRRLSPAPSLFLVGRIMRESCAYRVLQQMNDEVIADHADDGHRWLNVNRPYAELSASLAGKFRISLRSCLRNLSASGEVTFHRSEPGDADFESEFDTFLKIESSGWKGLSGSAGGLLASSRPNQLQLFKSLAEDSDVGTTEIFSLRVAGTSIAAQYWFRSGETRIAFRVGYLEDYARYQPGHLLIEHVARTSCDDPSIHVIDFVSDVSWLDKWRVAREPHFQYYLPVRRVSGFAARTLLRMPTSSEVRAFLNRSKPAPTAPA